MVDFPWYMGMAPLLGWCLDAVVASRRFDPLLPRAVRHSAARMEFVLRQAFPSNPERGGWMLVLWTAATAWFLGWVLTSGSWVIAGHGVSFAAWTALFFVTFSVRGQATAGVHLQGAITAEDPESAAHWLSLLGDEAVPSEDPDALAGAGVRQLAHSVVHAALIPLFWGLFLGAGGALGALCVHHIAQQIRPGQRDDPFWQPAATAGRWVSTAPSWVALFFIQFALPFAGGHRGAAMAGFLNRYREQPMDRVAAAVAYGLGLGRSARGPEDGAPVGPSDLHRATILLWTSTALAAASTTFAAALLYRFIL